MDLSIIIVNWNTRDLLQNCLRSIEASAAGLAVQTIVVDNNSADGSREMVRNLHPAVELTNSGSNLGFARANNLGLAGAKAPFILFLNPDTELRPGVLQQMVSFLKEHADVGALGCKIRNVTGDIQPLGLQWFPSPLTELFSLLALSNGTQRRLHRLLPVHDAETSGFVRKLFGACLMVRREILEREGSFDDRFFMYCEDVDLCRRITDAGWKLYYMSEAEILHLGAGASAQATSLFSVLMMCESVSKLMHKYYGATGRAAYRLAALAGSSARLLILLPIRILATCGRAPGSTDPALASRKYVAVLQWSLGLRKAVIRN